MSHHGTLTSTLLTSCDVQPVLELAVGSSPFHRRGSQNRLNMLCRSIDIVLCANILYPREEIVHPDTHGLGASHQSGSLLTIWVTVSLLTVCLLTTCEVPGSQGRSSRKPGPGPQHCPSTPFLFLPHPLCVHSLCTHPLRRHLPALGSPSQQMPLLASGPRLRSSAFFSPCEHGAERPAKGTRYTASGRRALALGGLKRHRGGLGQLASETHPCTHTAVVSSQLCLCTRLHSQYPS